VLVVLGMALLALLLWRKSREPVTRFARTAFGAIRDEAFWIQVLGSLTAAGILAALGWLLYLYINT
jgi:hypothetical protein